MFTRHGMLISFEKISIAKKESTNNTWRWLKRRKQLNRFSWLAQNKMFWQESILRLIKYLRSAGINFTYDQKKNYKIPEIKFQ